MKDALTNIFGLVLITSYFFIIVSLVLGLIKFYLLRKYSAWKSETHKAFAWVVTGFLIEHVMMLVGSHYRPRGAVVPEYFWTLMGAFVPCSIFVVIGVGYFLTLRR